MKKESTLEDALKNMPSLVIKKEYKFVDAQIMTEKFLNSVEEKSRASNCFHSRPDSSYKLYVHNEIAYPVSETISKYGDYATTASTLLAGFSGAAALVGAMGGAGILVAFGTIYVGNYYGGRGRGMLALGALGAAVGGATVAAATAKIAETAAAGAAAAAAVGITITEAGAATGAAATGGYLISTLLASKIAGFSSIIGYAASKFTGKIASYFFNWKKSSVINKAEALSEPHEQRMLNLKTVKEEAKEIFFEAENNGCCDKKTLQSIKEKMDKAVSKCHRNYQVLEDIEIAKQQKELYEYLDSLQKTTSIETAGTQLDDGIANDNAIANVNAAVAAAANDENNNALTGNSNNG